MAGGTTLTCVSLLESDSAKTTSFAIGADARVRAVQMLQGHLIYDCRFSDLNHCNISCCQSGQKKLPVCCALTNTGISCIYVYYIYIYIFCLCDGGVKCKLTAGCSSALGWFPPCRSSCTTAPHVEAFSYPRWENGSCIPECEAALK